MNPELGGWPDTAQSIPATHAIPNPGNTRLGDLISPLPDVWPCMVWGGKRGRQRSGLATVSPKQNLPFAVSTPDWDEPRGSEKAMLEELQDLLGSQKGYRSQNRFICHPQGHTATGTLLGAPCRRTPAGQQRGDQGSCPY